MKSYVMVILHSLKVVNYIVNDCVNNCNNNFVVLLKITVGLVAIIAYFFLFASYLKIRIVFFVWQINNHYLI